MLTLPPPSTITELEAASQVRRLVLRSFGPPGSPADSLCGRQLSDVQISAISRLAAHPPLELTRCDCVGGSGDANDATRGAHARGCVHAMDPAMPGHPVSRGVGGRHARWGDSKGGMPTPACACTPCRRHSSDIVATAFPLPGHNAAALSIVASKSVRFSSAAAAQLRCPPAASVSSDASDLEPEWLPPPSFAASLPPGASDLEPERLKQVGPLGPGGTAGPGGCCLARGLGLLASPGAACCVEEQLLTQHAQPALLVLQVMLLLTSWKRGSTQIIGDTRIKARPGSGLVKRLAISSYRCAQDGGGGGDGGPGCSSA